MKNTLKVLILSSILTLSSCGGKGLILYNDSNTTEYGTLTIRYEKSTEYKGYGTDKSISLSFYLYFLNKNTKPATIKATSAKIYREANKAEYTVNSVTFSYGSTLELQCDIEKSAYFTASLPTMTTEDKYYMMFEFNSKKLTLYFYNNPSLQSQYSSLISSKK